MVLESAAERVALLMAGVPGNAIEWRYIEDNGFKLTGHPSVFWRPPQHVKKAMK